MRWRTEMVDKQPKKQPRLNGILFGNSTIWNSMWLMVNQWNYDRILWEYNGIIKHGKLKKFRKLPSGKRSHTYGKIHHFSWEIHYFYGSFSLCKRLSEGIDVNVYQRVSKWMGIFEQAMVVEAPNHGWKKCTENAILFLMGGAMFFITKHMTWVCPEMRYTRYTMKNQENEGWVSWGTCGNGNHTTYKNSGFMLT